MTEDHGAGDRSSETLVEIHVGGSEVSAAAGGESGTRLTSEQIAALQQTLTTLVSGFQPPEEREERAGLRLSSLEVELGFKVETGSGSVLKLLFDATAEANITAKVVWSSPK